MRYVLFCIILMAGAFGIAYVLSDADAIELDANPLIYAGDAWDVSVMVREGQAGDDVHVMLFNGLRLFEETLKLGSGGVAVWRIPEGQLIQAGESLLVVQHEEHTVEKLLTVRPTVPDSVELFTTGNSLAAYGQGSATIMILPQDEWGNSPAESDIFSVDVQYPESQRTLWFTYRDGLGYHLLRSEGKPGRIRLSIDDEPLQADLEIMQIPGDPRNIRLEIEPTCVLNDGRDVMKLVATVHDAMGYPVADGTLLTFAWNAGQGYGQTIDGVATLRLPAPSVTGTAIFRASAGTVSSPYATLAVVEDACP